MGSVLEVKGLPTCKVERLKCGQTAYSQITISAKVGSGAKPLLSDVVYSVINKFQANHL